MKFKIPNFVKVRGTTATTVLVGMIKDSES
jgi:hypothetical protein